MKKQLTIFIIIILFMGLAVFLLSSQKPYSLTSNEKDEKDQTSNFVKVPEPTVTPTPIQPVEPVMGTVTGRLCYPSDFLPKGTIVAKNLSTNVIYSQTYPGSFAGGKMTYIMNLPAGSYFFKYVAYPNLNKPDISTSGYHTETCPDGNLGCAQENKRVNISVEVNANATTSGIDLCDFYYAQNDEPKF